MNETLETLCKSVEESGLFHPHPTDRLTDRMEGVSTEWVAAKLLAIQSEANRVLGVYPELLKKAVAGDGDLGPKCRAIEEQLRSKEPGTLPMSLYLDALDCWLWRYLPPVQTALQASRMAVKQYLMGLSRYDDHGEASPSEVIENLPATIDRMKDRFHLTGFDQARIAIAQASAGRHIQAMTARTRSAIQGVLIGAEQRRLLQGSKAYAVAPLEQKLRDTFGELNRDWRRIAVSETAINASDAYLSRLAYGTKVKWLSHPGACRYCESQNGKVFTVVDPSSKNKDPETEVWVGKQGENVGRAISKRKRIETGELVDREPEELVTPAIPAHPICRCLWVLAPKLQRMEPHG